MVGLSVGEQHFVKGGIAQDLRTDGRKRLTYRPIYVETGVIPQANGSARVRIGGTDVIASVKLHTKNHSRIEPAGIVSAQMEEEDVVAAAVQEEEEDVTAADKWRVSRSLFTIEEEDLEMVDDEVNDGELRVDIPANPTPFLTPCDSPPYFTPSPSPGRDMDDVINVYR